MRTWGLSMTDMCEIARTSVLQSGFSKERKGEILGDHYYLASSAGNDVRKTLIPDHRLDFRYEMMMEEVEYLNQHLREHFPEAVRIQNTMCDAYRRLQHQAMNVKTMKRVLHAWA